MNWLISHSIILVQSLNLVTSISCLICNRYESADVMVRKLSEEWLPTKVCHFPTCSAFIELCENKLAPRQTRRLKINQDKQTEDRRKSCFLSAVDNSWPASRVCDIFHLWPFVSQIWSWHLKNGDLKGGHNNKDKLSDNLRDDLCR